MRAQNKNMHLSEELNVSQEMVFNDNHEPRWEKSRSQPTPTLEPS